MRPLKCLVLSLAFLFVVFGCSSDPEPIDVDAASLSVVDSCGTSFTNRDEAGSARVTVRAPSGEAVPAGSVQLAQNGWSAKLEVGSGLLVWPCHDVANDFEEEHVETVLTAIGGTFQLVDPLPDAADAGGRGSIRGLLIHGVFETEDGRKVTLNDVKTLNPAWGFFGG